MNQDGVTQIALDALMVTLKVSMPFLVAGLVVGLLVSIFQAATQIQEVTLTFVPKMIAQAVYAGNDTIAKRPQAVRAFLSGWYEAVAFMRANKAATIPIAARQMDVSAVVAGKVYDELIDNYSRDGRFDPEGLRVLVDSLVEMGALRNADVTALYSEDYLPPR